MQTLFERYGGFPMVSRIVGDFYDKMMDEDDLATYFTDVDMRTLIDHQTKFVASVMGGPASFTNEHLRRVHERLHITDGHFDLAVTILRETFEDHGLDETDIGNVIADVRTKKPFIVTS